MVAGPISIILDKAVFPPETIIVGVSEGPLSAV